MEDFRQELFNYLREEHNLLLLENDMLEIEAIIKKHFDKKEKADECSKGNFYCKKDVFGYDTACRSQCEPCKNIDKIYKV